ncbi:TPA: GHKL domain-containing protein [Streptococcus agalactiae]|nr:GHKL domain-containing protein [Streptococcus agalactiae]
MANMIDYSHHIEVSLETDEPKDSHVLFYIKHKQIFIIENSIVEERIDASRLFGYGASSKGEDRGLGLYNVMKVIDRYPNASISTNSEQHTFRQGLEIIF